MNGNSTNPESPATSLSWSARWLVLVAGCLSWMCAGWQLAITSLAMRDAAVSLLSSDEEKQIAIWFGRLTCALLLGAATGGYLLGWIGDRYGRTRALAVSVLVYSIFSAAAVYARNPTELWLLRFLACLGVGGSWPNAVALVSEAWPNISRPLLAGALGTAANVGVMMISYLARLQPISADNWHWVMWLGASPLLLAASIAAFVPESPNWLRLKRKELASRSAPHSQPVSEKPAGLADIFQPSMIGTTLLAILLGAIPLFGGWGNSNWVMPWAAEVGDPVLKADLQLARSLPGTISSLLGGALAAWLGRRRSYLLLSLAALVCGEVLFTFLNPRDDRGAFLFWYAALGFFSGFYFGWLPLCLPELFPTRLRSVGAGVGFNWGRILTAVGVAWTSEMMNYFGGGYARVGQVTSLVYGLGILIIFFMPDTSRRELSEASPH